tara:strand:- start:4283 stop:5131 length:849 start_codon:yes stop_codon:yes gene_type:complete
MSDEQTTTNDNPVETQITDAVQNTVNTVLGSESDNQNDWRSTLSEDLKNDPTLSNFKDVESLAKTVVHQQKLLGSKIPLPKTDEERNELYTKLGRPETADKYEVTIPNDMEHFMPKEDISQFKNVAHKIGLNNEQVNALMEFQVSATKNAMDNQGNVLNQEKEQSTEALKKEWGYEYDKNVRAAQRALNVYGDNELQKLLSETSAGNNPAVIKFLATIGKEVTEDMAQNTTNNRLATSPLDAKEEINNVMADSKHAYFDPSHPNHNIAVEKMRQLHEKVYGK